MKKMISLLFAALLVLTAFTACSHEEKNRDGESDLYPSYSVNADDMNKEYKLDDIADLSLISSADSAAAHGLIVDCSHGNSGKDEHRQAQVVRDIAGRIAKGEQGITGIMMESFIEGGNQKAAPLDQLVYGKSITDKCLSWNTTEQLLRELAHAVAVRRWK